LNHSWKQLAVSAASGVVLFVVANLVVYCSSGFFQRERHYRETVMQVIEHPEVSVLLLGDSHVAKIPNEYLVPTVRNAAAGGDGYRECYAKLRYLLGHSRGIRTIFLTADYHMFGSGRVESSNRSFVDQLLLASGSEVGYEKGWLSAVFNVVPLFNDDFVQYLKKDLRVKLQRASPGAAVAPTVWQDAPAETRQLRASDTGKGDHRGVGDEPAPLLWYRLIIEMAQEHGVQVIPIRLPASAAYLAQLSEHGKAVVDHELIQLGMVSVVELGNAIQQPELFEDEDHVNPQGAALVLCMLQTRTGVRLGVQEVVRNCEGRDAATRRDAAELR
jgi:hypothetical protein